MVVDAHHHLWDPAHREYPWMGDELAAIRRRFDAGDLKPLLDANRIDRTVVVQTVSSVEETREFLQAAAENEFIAGVVGWVDLTDRSVAKTLAGLKRSEGGNFLVGIRHQVHDEPDPEWLLREDVQRGIAAVGEAGLVYDVLVRTRELPAALETVKRHAGMRFVIDHAAKPRIAAGTRDEAWEKALAPMADHANVTCKLSGLVTEADWKAWSPQQLEPYVNRVLEWFGPERCMFGSDWPVCLLAASYRDVVEAMRTLVGDDANVFGATATQVYGLAAPRNRISQLG
jgi:L-fuconolactonase